MGALSSFARSPRQHHLFEVNTYRFGGGQLWYSFWALLDEGEKQEAHATMRAQQVSASAKAGEKGTATRLQHAQETGLGENGHMLYSIGDHVL